ncbi:carbohydrate ABC transporter permease [Streptodolium elevatio]|uniref:Sugar ABC transporter permease n=1 Tax=Streptodolium elevatio TaxID=3157996 RepID=A0ABV3DSK5_9ACTN
MTDPPAGGTGSHKRPRRRRGPLQLVSPYLMVAPAILGVLFLLLYPVIKNAILGFKEYGRRDFTLGLSGKWIGLDNFKEILQDGEFWRVTWRSFWFTGITVVSIMVISTLIALMLTKLGKAMRIVVLTSLVCAWAMPIIAATTVFKWMFRSDNGVANYLLVKLGFDSFDNYTWFADGKSTMTVIILLIVWQSIPFATLTIYAGLTTVPDEVYESARLDGAGPVRIFTSITFPMLRPLFLLVTSLEVIWIFKCFAQIWAIAGQNGPLADVATLPVYAYQTGMQLKRYGVAGAISTVTVLILAAMLVFYFRQLFKQEREADK